MNEESIAPSTPTGPRTLPARAGRALKRLLGLSGESPAEDNPAPESPAVPEPSPELRSRAAARIQEYIDENAMLFDRATRYEARTERLRDEGTPSESARNRAERARQEIRESFADIRKSLIASDGEEGGRAFDMEISAVYSD